MKVLPKCNINKTNSESIPFFPPMFIQFDNKKNILIFPSRSKFSEILHDVA